MIPAADDIKAQRIASVMLSILLPVFALETVAVATGALFHSQKSPIGFFILFSFLGIWAWLFKSLKNNSPFKNFDGKYVLLIGAVTVFFFTLGGYYPESKSMNVYVVEENQATVFDYESVNNWAAQEQQPPTDYYLVHFFQKVMGYSAISLRMKNLIATVGILALILTLSQALTGQWLLTFLITLFFIGNRSIHHHTWFARPVALGMMHYLLVLSLLMSSRKNWSLPIIVMAFFSLIFSCGFQPAIGLFSVVSAWLLVFGVKGPFEKSIIKAFFIAAFLFIPTFCEMAYMSYVLEQFHNKYSVFMSSTKEIFYLETWAVIFRASFSQSLYAWILMVVLSGILGFSFLKTKSFKFVFLNYLGFVAVFILVFKLTIDYPMNFQYYTLSHVNAILILMLISGAAWKKHRALGLSTAIILVALNLLTLRNPDFGPWKRITPSTLEQVSSTYFYDEINRVAGPNDYVYMISLRSPGIWVYTRFTGNKYYKVNQTPTAAHFRPPFSKPIYLQFPETWVNDNYLVRDVMAKEVPENAVFVHYTEDFEENYSQFSEIKLPGNVRHEISKGFEIFIIPIKGDLASSVLPFYLAYVRSGKGNSDSVSLIETGLFLSLESKNKEAFMELFGYYSALLDKDFSKHPNYIRFHDCRFLARVFKERAAELGWVVK